MRLEPHSVLMSSLLSLERVALLNLSSVSHSVHACEFRVPIAIALISRRLSTFKAYVLLTYLAWGAGGAHVRTPPARNVHCTEGDRGQGQRM